jgi:hypothetical protein
MRLRTVAFAVGAAVLSGTLGVHASGPTPVIVELYTSEGCSSCPPADQLLARMAAAPNTDGALVIPLGEHVDYWDELGWRDRFSSSALTARQQVYAQRLSAEGPYTPEMVIDGRAECIGSDAAAAKRAITKAAGQPHGTIEITIAGAKGTGLQLAVRASNLPQKASDRADIYIAITEDHLRSEVTRGENHGRTLTHTAVVRQLERAGDAVGAAATAERAIAIDPSWRRDALHIVVFVQERRAGAILAAASVPLS